MNAKSRDLLCKAAWVKCLFIKRYKQHLSIKKLCGFLEVSRSGYYRWLQESVPKRKQREAKLKIKFLQNRKRFMAHQEFMLLPKGKE